MKVQCPHCGTIFDTRDLFHNEVEQATAAPGEVRTVVRPPAVVACETGSEPGGSDDY